MHRKRKRAISDVDDGAPKAKNIARRRVVITSKEHAEPRVQTNCARILCLKGDECDGTRLALKHMYLCDSWRTSVPSSHLLALPEDCMFEICAYLSFPDYLALMSTCRTSRLNLYLAPEWTGVLRMVVEATGVHSTIKQVKTPEQLPDGLTQLPTPHLFTYEAHEMCNTQSTFREFATIATCAYMSSDVSQPVRTDRVFPYSLQSGLTILNKSIDELMQIRYLQMSSANTSVIPRIQDNCAQLCAQQIFSFRYLASVLYQTKFRHMQFADKIIMGRQRLGLGMSLESTDKLTLRLDEAAEGTPRSGAPLLYSEYRIAHASMRGSVSKCVTMYEPIAMSLVAKDTLNGQSVFCALYWDPEVNRRNTVPYVDTYRYDPITITRSAAVSCHKSAMRLTEKRPERVAFAPYSECSAFRKKFRPNRVLENFIIEAETITEGTWMFVSGDELSALTASFLMQTGNAHHPELVRPVSISDYSSDNEDDDPQFHVEMPPIMAAYIYSTSAATNNKGYPTFSYSTAILTPNVLRPLLDGLLMLP